MEEDLSPEQSGLVHQFVDVTNVQDRNAAVRLLQASNWNLETALMLHFDGGVPPPAANGAPAAPPQPATSSSASSRSPPRSLMEELSQAQPSHDVAPRITPNPAVYTPGHSTGFSIIQTVLLMPFNLGYKVLNTVLYFLSWLFPVLPRLTGYYPANRNAATVRSDHVDPKTVAARFARNFEEKYGEHTLPFFEGGYSQALEEAKTGLKYFVVVLESVEHDLTESFNRDVMLNPQVVQLMKRPDIVLWAGDVRESESYQLASELGVTKFPFCALIAPAPKTHTSNLVVMTILARLKGVVDAARFVSTLEEKMETHQPKLMSLILDKQERDMSRQLREEQDSAYERSLAADRERVRQQEAERKRQEEVEERQKELETAKERREELRKQWIEWRAGELIKTKESSVGDKMARVSIRLMSGERVVEKFAPDASLEEVYAFVECYDAIKAASGKHLSKPEGYEHEYDFELVSPMPRKVIAVDPDALVKDEPSLWPNGSLVVEVKDNEDDE
ncbi:hypothetical protein TRVA0_032S01354 [Trichomonascus vanleenenianus]|uniref:clathrin-mediated endocytosis regulator UBX3 n=1 Tax=Trichomonascus vanleenenianus TaxID=2268995 RepID=UPI003ECB4D03